MGREFEIALNDANLEDANFRLQNEMDENGDPIPQREWVTGIDRQGNAARMAIKGRMAVVTHGYERLGSKIPYTLIIFEWDTERLRLDRRFREVTIEVSFTAHGTRRDAEPEAQRLRSKGVGKIHWDPEVCATAPEHTSWYHRTSHSVSEKDGVDINLQAGFNGCFTAGPRFHWERSDATTRTDAIQITGNRVAVGPGHSRPNAVRWVMLENRSQKSGVPAFLRTAVLLKRRPNDNGQFLGAVKVSYRVSTSHDFKESLLKALGKLPTDQPLIFDPRIAIPSPSLNFDSSNLADVDLQQQFRLISLEDSSDSRSTTTTIKSDETNDAQNDNE
ncbi:hypothetical protein HDV62DRAFT_358412 [Trichoderma sp. SZMC 28011]